MMEKLYQDFTDKLLPEIQEGFVINKDYFIDLFGRYITYLILIDSLDIVIGVILLVGTFYGGYRLAKLVIQQKIYEALLFFSILIIPIGLGFGFLYFGIINLIKDIYIPEVRIYEELKDFNK